MILSFKKSLKNLAMLPLILSCCIFTTDIFATDILPPWELVNDFEKDGNYLGAVMLLRDQEKVYSSSPFRIQYFDLRATF